MKNSPLIPHCGEQSIPPASFSTSTPTPVSTFSPMSSTLSECSMKNAVIDEKLIGSVVHCGDCLVKLVNEKWSDQ